MNAPGVTVVLPCFNAHRYLGEALASVRAQTFTDLEIIVVDDGSTDPDTRAFLAALPSDVQVVHQENRGLAGARNTGFREARGDLVLPLDCDDRLAPTMIERCRTALAGGAAYAYADIAVFGDEEGVVRKTFNFFEQLATNQLPYCLLLRRHAWEAVGGYDERMRLGYEDWEFNIRLGAAGLFGVKVAEPLFCYRVSRTGMLKAVAQHRHADLWRAIRRKHPDLYSFRGSWRIWRAWRHRPSSHPLAVVWLLLILDRLLPDVLFNRVFFLLHRVGRSRRDAT